MSVSPTKPYLPANEFRNELQLRRRTTAHIIPPMKAVHFGIEEVWVEEARIKMIDPERTLLDGLMAPHYCGDFSEVLHAFEMRKSKLDLQRIIGYALKLDAATAKRLGWVLEHQGVKASRLKELQAVPIKGYRVLDPTGPRRGPCNSRWMIQENLPGTVIEVE